MFRTSGLVALFLLASHLAAAEAVWLEDRREAFRVAKAERKLVFVDYRAEWCAPCLMMERDVFPTPAVQERLREYVLLRTDVDRAGPGLKSRKWELPTFTVYDWEERERFTFSGGMQAGHFLQQLDAIGKGAPSMVQAADLFAQKKDAEAWTAVAKGYTKVGAARQARDAWQRVQRASRGDQATAQAAALYAAFTWVIEEQPTKAVERLQKLTSANADTEGLRWYLLGQAYVKMKDVAKAREAFEKATALVEAKHPVAREAAAALAALR
ncbi:MAG TPA: thioredoxin family protein [Thermoanaerobaculia bacterium]